MSVCLSFSASLRPILDCSITNIQEFVLGRPRSEGRRRRRVILLGLFFRFDQFVRYDVRMRPYCSACHSSQRCRCCQSLGRELPWRPFGWVLLVGSVGGVWYSIGWVIPAGGGMWRSQRMGVAYRWRGVAFPTDGCCLPVRSGKIFFSSSFSTTTAILLLLSKSSTSRVLVRANSGAVRAVV